MTTLLASLILLHGGDSRMDLAYFWSAILMVLLPVGAFITMAWWLFRMYRREQKSR